MLFEVNGSMLLRFARAHDSDIDMQLVVYVAKDRRRVID
jgi:hypothetical protein